MGVTANWKERPYLLTGHKCLQVLLYPSNTWKRGKLCLINKPDKDKSNINIIRECNFLYYLSLNFKLPVPSILGVFLKQFLF